MLVCILVTQLFLLYEVTDFLEVDEAGPSVYTVDTFLDLFYCFCLLV